MNTFSFGFARHKWVKALVYAVVLCSMVLGLSLAPFNVQVTEAHGRECYQASSYQKVFRDNKWHWRAVATVTRRPIPSIGSWHVHGPSWAQAWPNSVSETYGKFYIYFSLPNWTYPKWPASDYSACIN